MFVSVSDMRLILRHARLGERRCDRQQANTQRSQVKAAVAYQQTLPGDSNPAAYQPTAIGLRSVQGDTDLSRQLYAAATSGGWSQAQHVWQEYMDGPTAPGFEEQHLMVYACCKWAGADLAHERLLSILESGMQALPETYLLVILAYLRDGDLKVAQQVYSSLMRTHPSRQGWLAMVEALFTEGYGAEGIKLLDQGQSEDGYTSSKHANSLAFQYLCSDSGLYPLAMRVYQDAGCQGLAELGLQTAQVNKLLSGMAKYQIGHQLDMSQPERSCAYLGDGVAEAERLLSEMLQGKLGSACRPDTNSFNAIIEGCLVARAAHQPEGDDRLDALKGRMYLAQVRPNRRTHALYVEAFLGESRYKHAMKAFSEMVELGEPGILTTALSPGVLRKLMVELASTCQPLNLWEVVSAAAADNIDLAVPEGDDPHALSFAARWIPAAILLKQRAYGAAGGLPDDSPVQDAIYRDSQGHKIGAGSCVITEEGAVVPVSKMTVGQLRAELQAKGLRSEGKRQDMYRRVQALRQSASGESANQEQVQALKRMNTMRELLGDHPQIQSVAEAATSVSATGNAASVVPKRQSLPSFSAGDIHQDMVWLRQKLQEEKQRLRATGQNERDDSGHDYHSGRFGQLTNAEVDYLTVYLERFETTETDPFAELLASSIVPDEQPLSRLAFNIVSFLEALNSGVTDADWWQVAKAAALESLSSATKDEQSDIDGCDLDDVELLSLYSRLKSCQTIPASSVESLWTCFDRPALRKRAV